MIPFFIQFGLNRPKRLQPIHYPHQMLLLVSGLLLWVTFCLNGLNEMPSSRRFGWRGVVFIDALWHLLQLVRGLWRWHDRGYVACAVVVVAVLCLTHWLVVAVFAAGAAHSS